MNELQTEINEAFKLVAAMSVSGDDQDRAAMAKAHLTRAFILAKEDDKAGPATTTKEEKKYAAEAAGDEQA